MFVHNKFQQVYSTFMVLLIISFSTFSFSYPSYASTDIQIQQNRLTKDFLQELADILSHAQLIDSSKKSLDNILYLTKKPSIFTLQLLMFNLRQILNEHQNPNILFIACNFKSQEQPFCVYRYF